MKKDSQIDEKEIMEAVEALASIAAPSSSPQVAEAYERLHGEPISQGKIYRRLLCALSQGRVTQDKYKRWVFGDVAVVESQNNESTVEPDVVITSPTTGNAPTKPRKTMVDRGLALQAANAYEAVSNLLRSSPENTKIIKSAKELADYYMEKCYGI
jgi:hypothetical protein